MTFPNGQFRLVFSPKDFAASAAFYREGLALPVDHEWDYGGGDRGIVFVAASGMIELMGLTPGAPYVQPQGLGVLIQVDSADRWFSLARERGLKIVQEPTSYPWGQRVVRLEDPDGLEVSLFSTIPTS
jgi:predicted enzyme related to lactoylglutathione lyase